MSLLNAIVTAIVNLASTGGGSAQGQDSVQGHGSGNLSAALDARAGHLDWRHSIVDLMKLAGMDSSLEARKELAQELGYSGELNGSAEMNRFLYSRVMAELTRTR